MDTLSPRQANEKQNKKAAAEGAELDGPAAVVKDMEMAKLLLDLKVVVDNPVVGEKPLVYNVELSRMDVERGFIESQDRDEALEAIVTGNVSLLANSNELDLEEFFKCIAFCGLNMFRNIKEMPETDKVLTLLEIYVGDANTATPADRIKATVKKVLSKGLVRFDPDADLSEEEATSANVSEEFIGTWKKMILDDCHGYPLWEKEMFLLLASKYEELYSIFTFYAKSGGTGSSASSGFMLQQAEITNLALDCQLTTPEFAMARIHLIMKMSDQADKKLTGDAAIDDRMAATGYGDKALELFEFLELLVRLSLQRQNPKLGTVGNEHTVEQPLPGCLDFVLNEHIIKLAKKDGLKDVLDALKEDQEALAYFEADKKRLKKSFEKICLETRDGSRMFSQVVMAPQAFLADLVNRKCTKDAMITPTPAVTGDDTRPRHSNLSQLDAKGAFTTAQDKNESTGNAGSSYEEWCMCLGLCGHIKYEEIEEMSLAARVKGMIDNYLGERDEQAVISEALYPPLPRYDILTASPLDGEDKTVFKNFKTTWKAMDLGHVYGFPLWEQEAFEIFHEAFERLSSIFDYYAKSGTAGSASAGTALTMQQTELTNLALDVGLASAKFPMVRVINIFKRADQVDDTFVVDKADRRVVHGETAKGGDKGLELHEFFECVVMIAFQRANPKYGEVGHSGDSLKVGVDGSSVRETKSKGKALELEPVPSALRDLLFNVLLKKAKTDSLAKVKKELVADPDCQRVIKERRSALAKEFKKISLDGVERGFDATTSMDQLQKDVFERNVLKDVHVSPTPAVTGDTPPDVHSNLSWLDFKGAFVTGQDKDASGADNTSVTFDEFVMVLGLCAHIKYEEVEEMPLAVRLAGIFCNYLGEKDEHAVISEYLYPPPERFTPPAGVDALFLAVWSKIDLSHVFGFPTFEAGVFKLFLTHFGDLASIFTYYAKSGSAGAGSANALLTMQQTELQNLAMDCQLSNEAFSMTRVINIFERADQIDDTFVVDKADRRVVKGQTAKGGDHGLELHEFFECLVMLALQKANPKFGEVGHNTSVEFPLPGCLDTLLKKSILKKAKSDNLAKTLKRIKKEPDVLAVIKANQPALQKIFLSKSTGAHSRTANPLMTMEQFLACMVIGLLRTSRLLPSDGSPDHLPLAAADRLPSNSQSAGRAHRRQGRDRQA